MSKAYARTYNIEEHDEYPVTSIKLTVEEWKTLKFEHWIFDNENKEDFPEERYNLLLVHPVTGEIFWGYTHDFDYT